MVLLLMLRYLLWNLFLKNLTTCFILRKERRLLNQIRFPLLPRLNAVIIKDSLLNYKFHVILMLLSLLTGNRWVLRGTTATTVNGRVSSAEIISTNRHVSHTLRHLGRCTSLKLLHFLDQCLLSIHSFLDVCDEFYPVDHCIKPSLRIWRSPGSH